MKYCMKCGTKLSDRAAFCLSCGTPIEKQVAPAAPPEVKPAKAVAPPPPVAATEPSIVGINIMGFISKLFAIISLFFIGLVISEAYVYSDAYEQVVVFFHYDNIFSSMSAALVALVFGIIEFFMSAFKRSKRINIFNIIARLVALVLLLVILVIMLVTKTALLA